MTSARHCPLMRLNLSVMFLINRAGMVLMTVDPLMVAGLGLLAYWLTGFFDSLMGKGP